ncbi:hypothetical protein ZWY2020_051120 [Hordeum vulgare]|nr:hypothetical protein ZWY2020_051120 [Hordeum vulgare]
MDGAVEEAVDDAAPVSTSGGHGGEANGGHGWTTTDGEGVASESDHGGAAEDGQAAALEGSNDDTVASNGATTLDTTTPAWLEGQILEKTTKEKGKGGKSGSGGAKRSRSQPICGEHDVSNNKTHHAMKVHAKRKNKEVC